MKIALITKRVSESLGGAESVSLNLCRKLQSSGHDVHIFTRSSDASVSGVHLHHIKVSRWLSPWTLLSFQKKTRKCLEADTFDIVYSLCQVYPTDIYRVGDGIHQHWMNILYPNPIWRWTKYATSLVHLTMRYLENKILTGGNCNFFITNSRLVKNQLVDYFQIPEDRIRVIYNGVDHDKFNTGVRKHRALLRENYHISDDEFVLLFISNNWERKGLATVIEALGKLGNKNVKLMIVGRGKKTSYISLAHRKKIDSDRLIFTGRIRDIEKLYGMADIFILPSRYEPFANVCLEAMACGLPVITTKDNGASELINPGKNGFIMDDWRNSDSLADSIRKLQDAEVRGEMGDNAAETSMKYDWDPHIEETTKIFELLGKSR